MLRLLLAISITLLTFSQCKTSKKPEKEAKTEVTKVPEQVAPPEKEKEPTESKPTESEYQRPEGKKYTKGAADQPSNNVLEFFSTDYWVPQFAISSLSKKAHLPYRNMWLKFDKKGQFKGGIGKTSNIRGSWKFDAKSSHLFIISNNVDLDGKWKVNRSGFDMVWLARKGQKLQDIQIKLVNSTYKPGEE